MNQIPNWAQSLTGPQPLQQWLAQHAPTPALPPLPPVAPVTANAAMRMPSFSVGHGFRYGNLEWFPVWVDATYSGSSLPSPLSTDPAIDAVRSTIDVAAQALPQRGGAQAFWSPLSQSNSSILVRQGSIIDLGEASLLVTESSLVASGQLIPKCLAVRSAPSLNWSTKLSSHDLPLDLRLAASGITVLSRGTVSLRDSVSDAEIALRVRQASEDFARSQGLHEDTPAGVAVKLVSEQLRSNTMPVAKALDGQRGVIVAMAGEPIFMEVFEDTEQMAASLNQILEANLAVALREPFSPCSASLARRFARAVERRGANCGTAQGALCNELSRSVATTVIAQGASWVHLVSFNLNSFRVRAAVTRYCINANFVNANFNN